MAQTTRSLVFCLVTFAIVACGAPAPAALARAGTMAIAPPAAVTPSPSPSPVAAAPAPRPASTRVFFSGIPAGTYPVHLHSQCSGVQAFHVTVLQSLVVRGGAGSIGIPSGYFGRGLCVIVYTDASLSRVLTTRRLQ